LPIKKLEMSILTINCGSSSLKFSLYKTGKFIECEKNGVIEKIGETFKNHEEAIRHIMKDFDKSKIKMIVHRVVHGGEKFSKPTVATGKTIKELEKISSLAPLHNPANIKGIKICKKIFPKIKQVIVFDTAFYSSLEEKSYAYAIPKELRTKFKIRKYGFHGTNHKFVAEKAIELMKSKRKLKIISCHLGNGSSVTASIGGKAIETSMGFTPLDGLVMGKRCGAIDPGAVLKIQQIKKFSPEQASHFLNNKCGLYALSELSGDMREIYQSSLKGRERSTFTIEYISYQLAKIIGSYISAMSGLDALIFTAAMGENAFYIREKTCGYLSYIGIKLDRQKNKKCEQLISSKKSKIKVFVIKANEELQMVKETLNKI